MGHFLGHNFPKFLPFGDFKGDFEASQNPQRNRYCVGGLQWAIFLGATFPNSSLLGTLRILWSPIERIVEMLILVYHSHRCASFTSLALTCALVFRSGSRTSTGLVGKNCQIRCWKWNSRCLAGNVGNAWTYMIRNVGIWWYLKDSEFWRCLYHHEASNRRQALENKQTRSDQTRI